MSTALSGLFWFYLAFSVIYWISGEFENFGLTKEQKRSRVYIVFFSFLCLPGLMLLFTLVVLYGLSLFVYEFSRFIFGKIWNNPCE